MESPSDEPTFDAMAAAVPGTIDAPPVDLTSGLVGYWPLDGPAGASVVKDQSGNNNDGTLTMLNVDTAWQPGRVGLAVDIPDREGAAVVVARTDSLDSITSGLTIAAWVFRNVDLGSRNAVVVSRQRGEGSREHYNLAFQDNKLVAWFADAGTASLAVRANESAPLMTWIHVALTWDGATIRLYQDGIEVGTGRYTSPIPTSVNPLMMGNNTNASGIDQPLAGRLDEVRLYNRALPAEAIQVLGQGM